MKESSILFTALFMSVAQTTGAGEYPPLRSMFTKKCYRAPYGIVIPLWLLEPMCLPVLKQGSLELHETCFRDVDRAAVAALHGLLKAKDIGNMIHDIELGAGDFALVEIGIVVAVAQFF